MPDVEFKTDGLDKLIKMLKVGAVTAKVGILGSHNGRSDSVANNAEVGATHEFGTSTVPKRSFLREPLTKKLPKELEKAGLFTKEDLDKVFAQKSFEPWIEKAAILAVGVVLDAFDSGGPGWTALKPETLAKKKVKQILVETGQLRDSITYEIVGSR